MSETMIPIPFPQLLDWIESEYAKRGSVFGVRLPYLAGEKTLPLFGGRLETPVTWETQLSAKGNSKETWESLIDS